MPIVKIDDGLTKAHMKKIAIGTLIATSLLTTFVMRTRIEEGLANVLWSNQILPGLATSLYSLAASDGSIHSQSALGDILRRPGRSQEENIVGITWLRTASEQGDMKSMYDLGTAIANGSVAPLKPQEAVNSIQTALNSGYLPPPSNPPNLYLAKAYLIPDDPSKPNKISQNQLNSAKRYGELAYLDKVNGSEEVMITIYSHPELQDVSEEERLLKIAEFQKSLLRKGEHVNGAIALTYNLLYSKTLKENYRQETISYGSKALQDKQDPNAKYFKAS